MSNRKNVFKFIKALHFLQVEQKITLFESLRIIAGGVRTEKGKSRTGKLQKAALYIESKLVAGNSFSTVLRTCPFIRFDDVTLSFVEFSSKTGNLSETLSFLKERCERKEAAFSKILEASVYPSFVILLSLFVSVLMLFYGKSLLGEEFFSEGLLKTLLYDLIFLFVFCFFVFLLLKKNLGENLLYEAFLATGFLIRHGVNASLAWD